MKYICTKCGHEDEINPAAILGGMTKTMTDEAIEARRANLVKANESRKRKRAEREAG